MLSGNNGIKLEIINRKKFVKLMNMWKSNNILLNKLWKKEEIMRMRNTLR